MADPPLCLIRTEAEAHPGSEAAGATLQAEGGGTELAEGARRRRLSVAVTARVRRGVGGVTIRARPILRWRHWYSGGGVAHGGGGWRQSCNAVLGSTPAVSWR